MDLATILYNSEDTNNQVDINSVLFHPLILETFSDYFKENKSINKTIENSALKDLPLEILKTFKKIVYHQKIYKEDLTGEQFASLYNFLDYICVDTKVIYDTLKDLEYLPFFIQKEDVNMVKYILRKTGYFPLNLFKGKDEFLGLVLVSVKVEYLDDIKTDNLFLKARIAYFKKNFEEARSLCKKNWEENKHSMSLFSLAYMIKHGEGGYKNLEEARSLYKKNWEENKVSISLHNLAFMIDNGEGGYKNEEEARSLLQEKLGRKQR
jgi:hypothetical protein